MSTTTSFYMVMRDKEGTYISKRHPIYDEVVEEAKQLAGNEQKPFVILKAIAMVAPVDVPVIHRVLEPSIAEEYDILEQVKQKTRLIKDTAVNYDGYREAEDLMKLIDEMRELAEESYMLLDKIKDE